MANQEIDKNKYLVAAYLSDNGVWGEEDIEPSKLTHINYAFGLVENGKLGWKHLKKLDCLKKYKEINPELKIVLSIGGWGADGFSDAALTQESRNKFVDSVMEFVVINNFDGVDIDWEYPCNNQAGIKIRKEDRENFTLYLKNFREKLDTQGKKDTKNYILSIAIGAGQRYIDDIEMEKVHPYLNFINVMTYDMRGSYTKITGHHANLFSSKEDAEGISGDKAVNLLLLSGVPNKKIILGSAFYSRCWEKVKNQGTGINVQAETTGCKTIDYSALAAKYINKNGFVRYWDDQSKAPYLFNGSTFISYEDKDSLEYKANYVIDKNIGGLMFWEYPLDNTHELVDTIYSVLVK